MQRVKLKLEDAFKTFQLFTKKSWYAAALGFLAAIDTLIVIVPVDGLLISSTLLAPQKWWRFWLWTAVGSTAGAFVFSVLVANWGWSFLHFISPGLEASGPWLWAEHFFKEYGLGFVFLVALAPILQQPMIALAMLAHHSLWTVTAVILAGRLIKYFIMASVSRFAPDKLRKLWGVADELEEVQIKKPL